ncbi:LacI family DNA-binding transcriptional regulator [Streptomyces flavofungini]|uniref:LacI family DNA-binding transcriptional regulator n=1 Tax=Streptomyces flavofungini TaxID=68200 RepID=UPI0025B2638B|nr:LacI family DNA-binding transcriptional regulator [Streptomyces flavofungini]WJV45590.1 LacI family DNA-binding transcriptional regulator [Streptomyces flavofungini]
MPDSGPTLADVARAAEVSTATVSHALNGTGRLSDATRRRVRATATALGYGAPRRGPRTRTLGIAVTTFPGPWNYAEIAYFSRAVTAATAAAHAHGYALTTLPADRLADAAWHTLAVDGMLIADSPPGDPMARALRARGIPVVFDGVPGDVREGDHWIDNDHTATTREVLDHLTAAGARRVALQAGSGAETYARAVTQTYEQWCAERGVAARAVRFDAADAAGRAFDGLLTGADRADAVYAAYDPGGHQLLAAARRHGLRVPDDLLLVCASEDPGYARTAPPVSTVSLNPELMARAAVDRLVALVEGAHPPAPGPTLVPAALHARTSSRGGRRPRMP